MLLSPSRACFDALPRSGPPQFANSKRQLPTGETAETGSVTVSQVGSSDAGLAPSVGCAWRGGWLFAGQPKGRDGQRDYQTGVAGEKLPHLLLLHMSVAAAGCRCYCCT